jgi:hypothetical protein
MNHIDEISNLKERLAEYEEGGDAKLAKIQELHLEIEDMTEQYEQNKKDLYEQLDQKDQSLSESWA